MTDAKFFRSGEEDYWDTYLAVRPKYRKSGFYDIILDYHRHHDGAFELAHDIACGPGNVAAELAKHFKHVVASDINDSNVAAARSRLGHAGVENVSFVTSPSQAIVQHAASDSVDLITVAESIALMDMPKSLAAFHTILKPQGTLAMWLYGRPHFVSPEDKESDEGANAAYVALADYTYGPLINAHKEMVEKPSRTFHNWCDGIELPATEWKDIRRQKWNPDAEMNWATPTLGGMNLTNGTRRVGEHEDRSEAVDRSFWAEQWTAEDAVRFLRVSVPHMPMENFVGEGFDRLFSELRTAFGGEGARKQVTWPVILILAAKQ